MQTPLNYQPLLTLIKYGLLFGLVSQDDIVRWDALHNSTDPFLHQLALAGSADDLNALINGRRIAGPDIITARALLNLIYQKLSEGILNTQQAMQAANAIHDMHLLGPAEQDQIHYLNYEYETSITDPNFNDYNDFNADLLDFLIFYEAYLPENVEKWPYLNLEVEEHFEAEAEHRQQYCARLAVQKREAKKKALLTNAAIIAAAVIVLFVMYELIDYAKSKSDQFGSSVWMAFPALIVVTGKLVYAEVKKRWPGR